ncbi:hypothetical protein JW851_04060 [Candidatus Woesearchaeota archaeon]|nr:hypothetical protein [Candidatus Woesearchaeota archaeon]
MGIIGWFFKKSIYAKVLGMVKSGKSAKIIVDTFKNNYSLGKIKAAINSAAAQDYNEQMDILETKMNMGPINEGYYISRKRMIEKRRNALIQEAEVICG